MIPVEPIYLGSVTTDFEARTVTHTNADGEVTKVEQFDDGPAWWCRLIGVPAPGGDLQ